MSAVFQPVLSVILVSVMADFPSTEHWWIALGKLSFLEKLSVLTEKPIILASVMYFIITQYQLDIRLGECHHFSDRC